MRIVCGPGRRPSYRCTSTGAAARSAAHGADGGGGYGGSEIMATTFDVPVKRLILIAGTRLPGPAGRDSYRIRALDPDVMSDEQFDEQVRRLRAERDRLKALPAEPDRREEQLTGDSTSRRSPCLSAARG